MVSYERCWAKAVSECGEGMSKEHYFTRGIFPTAKVKVRGTSPLPEDQRDIHIDKLVAKVLCRKHNAELSPLDDALIDLVNSVREVERLRVLRAGIVGTRWPPTRFTVDGARVERCVLKMLMNQSVVQRGALNDWAPPDWIPQVVFGQRPLDAQCGLSVVARVGDVVTNAEEVGFVFGQSERSGTYESVLLEIQGGWRFLCTWERALESLGELRFPGGSYGADEDVMRHPARIQFTHGPHDLGLSVDFDWSGNWTSRKYKNVAALRAKYGPPPR